MTTRSPAEPAARDLLVQIDKVLALEARQGHRDAAAVNGLTQFVGDRTTLLLRQMDDVSRRRLQDAEALLADYSGLSPEQRARNVAEARQVLEPLLRGAPGAQAPPSRPAPSPPARPAPVLDAP